jgi:hypothetical protein
MVGTHRKGGMYINTHMVSGYPKKGLTKYGIPHGKLKHS